MPSIVQGLTRHSLAGDYHFYMNDFVVEVLRLEKKQKVLYVFLVTVKAAQHECVIRNDQP